MRVTANGRTPKRAGNDSLIAPPVARVVLPCSVNERLRGAGQFKGGVSGTPRLSRRMQRGAPCPGCAGEAAGAAGNVRRMDSSTRRGPRGGRRRASTATAHAIKAPSREAASAFHLAVINLHEG